MIANCIIQDVLYRYTIMVSVGEDDAVLRKRLTKRFNIDKDSNIHLWTSDDMMGRALLYTNGTCLIRLRDFSLMYHDISALTHEVLHIVFFVMNDRGVELSDSSDEAFCYYHGWLMEQVLKKLAKYE